jgi:hypothetical protein
MENKSYIEKLKDPRWQKIRLKVFQRDEWRCQKCYSDEQTLHVHHRFYDRLKYPDPWQYPLELLVTLCSYCHEVETDDMKEVEFNLLKSLKKHFFSDQIYEIHRAFGLMELCHIPDVVSSSIFYFLTNIDLQKIMVSIYQENLKGK